MDKATLEKIAIWLSDPVLYRIFEKLDTAFAYFLTGYILYRYWVARRERPVITKETVRFQDWFASGSSGANFITRNIVGAAYTLRLVVTNEAVWYSLWFPFTLFAAAFGLERTIPLTAIKYVQRKPGPILNILELHYQDARGRERFMKLIPRDTNKFLQALPLRSDESGQRYSPTDTIIPC